MPLFSKNYFKGKVLLQSCCQLSNSGKIAYSALVNKEHSKLYIQLGYLALALLSLKNSCIPKLCTIASKINVTPKDVYLPISKLHSIFAVANLLAHNNKIQICYCGQISLQSAAVNCIFLAILGPLGVTFILLSMVPVLLPCSPWGEQGNLTTTSDL